MRIQPRQQTLEVWRAMAQYARSDGKWSWEGRDGANSISNAEQLLCLLYPATEISSFRLDVPDQTADDVLDALRPLGDGVEIPKLIVDLGLEYMTMHRTEKGAPSFAGGSYFQQREGELTEQQRALDVVDSYSMSITLSLSVLGFLRVFSASVRRPELRKKIARLEELASTRLSAAMVGLLRCFTVNVFEPDSNEGMAIIGQVNQAGLPDKVFLERLHRRLRPIRASLRDARLGISQEDALDNENMLFEVGWSWGVVTDAPPVETSEPVGDQPTGVAIPRPYLYFTVTALDGIADLFSERTRVLGLLNQEQQRLSQALQLRWELALGYWSAIARFGDGRWPVEDTPWRTSDGEESNYYSLLVASLVVLDLVGRRATDEDLTRSIGVLEEMAIRGRINRRITRTDSAAALHSPGVVLSLRGSDEYGPRASWVVSDFSAVLLKRAMRAAGLSRNIAARDRLLRLSEDAMEHLWRRRLREGTAAGLWDDTSTLFSGTEVDQRPSWYLTERVMEGLVTAAAAIDQRPIRSPRLIELTTELIAEAEHLVSREQFYVADDSGSALQTTMQRIQAKLQRAKDLVEERPGTAYALTSEVLRELDELAVARQDVARSL